MQQINSLPDVGKPFRLPMVVAVRWFAARADKLVSLLLAALCFGLVPVEGATLPGNFTETTIAAPSGGNWNEAVGVRFEENGRMYVWERGGRVWIKEYGASTWSSLIDISEEVGGWRDFGLLGFVLDPNFRVNGYIYLMYVVDRHHLMNFGTPSYNPASDQYFAATIGRITRYTARSSDGFRTVDPASRRILLGETRQTGIPILHESHGIGTLVFGTDGTLLASCGDGASYSSTDTGSASETYYSQGLTDGIIKTKENIGAYRSQLLDSHNGKVLRLDPATGDGLPSNPFYDSASPRSARSRVWALGLRNPCRMTLKPGTGSHLKADGNPGVLYIGDVGYNTWEDLNVSTGAGKNFGWPAFEGLEVQSGYYARNTQNLDAPNPFYGVGGCTQQYLYFNQLIKQDSLNPVSFIDSCGNTIPGSIPRFIHTRPAIDWRHGQTVARTGIYDGSGNAAVIAVGAGGSPVSGSQFPGNCSIGGVWYTANDFPAQYKNTYFHADYGANWIQNFVFDANDKPTAVRTFLSGGGGVVAIATHPIDGGLYYISWSTTLRKITYVASGNLPPTAVVSANNYYGPGPLTVQFTGGGSTDPESLPLSYNWNFGDGTPNSTAANPSHTFNAAPGVPTKRTVTLTVTDSALQTSTMTVIISVNNTPPSVAITTPVDGTEYPLTGGTVYSLTANVVDAEFADSQLKYEWQTILHHNNHEHAEPIDTNHVTTTVISPVGCDGNTYYYRIVLTVTDPAGLFTQREVGVYPDCGGGPNTAPTISNIADQSTTVGVAVGPLSFTVGDAETAAGSLTVTGSSANTVLVPNGNIVFGGSGANRTVTVTPAAGQSGTATITVTVSDGTLTANDTFVLTVNAAASGGLVAAYGFNEASGTGVTDASGSGNNGTIGTATRTASGKYGSALTFNGSGAEVTVPDANSLDLTTGMTVEAWVNPTAVGGWRDVIYKGPNDTYFLMGSSDNSTPALGGTFATTEARGTTGLALNTWTHLAGTYDGVTMRMYVNGVQVGSRAQTGAIQASTGALTIGGDALYGQYFAGMIDEVRVYNRALSATEIQSDMNTAVGGSPVPNTTPTISDIVNQSINEDTATGALAFTVGDAETAAGSLTVTGSSGNTTVVPNGNITFEGSGANRTVTVTPAANQSGSATITVNVSDGSLTASDTFVVTVNAVNDVPTISNIADQSTAVNTATAAIAFTVGDLETAAGSLTMSGSSANTVLVPDGNIVFGGSGASRTVTITPAANQTGSATITVTVSDGTLTANDTFVLTVSAGNTAPTISDILNQTINEDAATGALEFTVGDGETGAGSLTVTGSSGNTTVVPNGNIVFGGSGASRTVTVTPAANQSGTATITVSVSDGLLTANDPFVLTVNAVNDTPTISNIADQNTTVGVAVGPLSFTVGDAETAAGSLTVTGSSGNTTVVPNGNIVFGGSGANRTVTVTPAAGRSGTATITVTVSDGTLTANDTFVLTVNAAASGGLVAAYGFNEGLGGTITDASGNANTGTISGATWTTQGRSGGALSFNGSSSLVMINDSSSLDLTSAMTLEAWVFPAVSQSGWRTVIQKEVDTYLLHASSESSLVPATGATYSGNVTWIPGPGSITVGQWTHLAGTYDGARLRLYVNGVEVASVARTGAISVNNLPVRIGGNSPYGEFFNGRIDEVRIYNRALSATEIQSDMNTPVASGPAPAAVKIPSKPRIAVAGINAAGSVTLRIESEVGQTVAVEVSANLTDWTQVATLENMNGTTEFTDAGASGQTRRFYRAVSVSKPPVRTQ